MLKGWVIQNPSTGRYFRSSQFRVAGWSVNRPRIFWTRENAELLYRLCSLGPPVEIRPIVVVLVVEKEGDTQGVGDHQR